MSEKWKHLLEKELSPNKIIEPLFSYKIKQKKIEVFFLEDEKGSLQIPGAVEWNCSSLIEPTDPKLNHLKGLPEMDAFCFVSREEAKKMVFRSQKFIFEKGYLEGELQKVNRAFRYQNCEDEELEQNSFKTIDEVNGKEEKDLGDK
jgi:hypothetical protein